MKEFKKMFLQDILKRLLVVYDNNGLTIADYQREIIMPDLTDKELEWLKESANGKF